MPLLRSITGSPRSWAWLKVGNKRKLRSNRRRKIYLERIRIKRLMELVRLDVWVQVTFDDKPAAPVWLRFRIPADLMAHLQSSQKNTQLEYRGHQHGAFEHKFHFPAFTVQPKYMVLFPFEYLPGMKSAVIGSKMYCFGGRKGMVRAQGIDTDDQMSILHRPRYLDFSSKIKTFSSKIKTAAEWEIGEPLCSPRYSPEILVVEDKLYVFGENVASGCFAEVFDPLKGYWEALPDAPFGHIPSDHLIVAFGPSPQILLLNKQDNKAYLYDPTTQSWDSYESKFTYQLSRLHGQPIMVENTVFWLDKNGNIFSFDWETGELLGGSVAGLCHELQCRDGWRLSVLSLFHLVDELFCLVWDDQSVADVHLSIIRVGKKPVKDCLLAAVVVACIRCKVHKMSRLLGGQLL